MKLNSVQAAVAAAVAMLAGAAAQAAPITYPLADPDAKIVNMSGATATDIVLSDALINDSTASLCDPALADIEVYTSESTFLPTVANYAIACHTRTTATPAAAANAEVIFRKYSGGSGSGISNVASGATLNNDAVNNRQWVDVLACRAAQPVGTSIPAANGRSTYILRTGCATTAAGRITHSGISDVEPALLAATAPQLANLTVNSGVAVDFSPIVSTSLYTALQTAQNLTGCGVNDQTPACIPNLSSTQLRGIYKGGITSMGQLYNNPATNTGTATAIAVGTNNLYICRRGNSSGTQTSYQVHFLRQGCGTAGVGVPSLAFTGATGTGITNNCTPGGCGWNSGTYGADRVFAGTGASDVAACVNYRSTQGQYAVGVLSSEVKADDANNAAFRHVKVDGVLPSLENIRSGAYDFFTENTMNLPSGASPQNTGAGGIPVLSTLQANVPVGVLNAMRAPASIKASLVSHPWGWGGVLAIPTTASSSPVPVGTDDEHAGVLANPVNSSTRAATYGGAPNNCNPAWNGARTLVPRDTNTL